MKPHIWKAADRWYCIGRPKYGKWSPLGIGNTPEEAYDDWVGWRDLNLHAHTLVDRVAA